MRRLLSTLTVASLLGATPALAAATSTPHIVDQAGDANGLNGQWYGYGTVGAAFSALYDILFGGEDPFGQGQQTPASFGPADIREAQFETMYEAIPVGEDGVDYVPTGVRVRIKTEEPAIAPDGADLAFAVVLTQYDATTFMPCETTVYTRIDGSGEPDGIRWTTDTQSPCSDDLPDGLVAGWSAHRDDASREVVFEMSASPIDGAAAAYFSEGALFSEPRVVSSTGSSWATLDVTRRGSEFAVGDGMPLDIPCTRGCPTG